MSDISIENSERYVMNFAEYSLYYYPAQDCMTINFYSVEEDEDYEIIVYDEDGFHIVDDVEENELILKKYLSIFKEYK